MAPIAEVPRASQKVRLEDMPGDNSPLGQILAVGFLPFNITRRRLLSLLIFPSTCTLSKPSKASLRASNSKELITEDVPPSDVKTGVQWSYAVTFSLRVVTNDLLRVAKRKRPT